MSERSDAVEIARMDLAAALSELRYSAQMPPTRNLLLNSDESEVEFLAQVTAWIGSFGGILQSVSETTTDMARELTELRAQRKAVRDFLGLSYTPEGNTA